MRPQAMKNCPHEMKPDQPTKQVLLSASLYMALANGHGLSNESCRELMSKDNKVMLYLSIKLFYCVLLCVP